MNFIKFFFSYICTGLSIIFLFFIIYKSEYVYFGSLRNYFLNYYIFSVCLILFSIFSFWFNDNLKVYFFIIFSSIFITLYCYEAYLNFLSAKNRTKLDYFEDLKLNSSYKDLVVASDPGNYIFKRNEIFPLSGISVSKTLHCNENGYYSIYDSDRYGFNNPNKEWEETSIEYLLIGDSFTHGSCVNRPHDISSVLRNLSNKSVLNLGYNGNGPLIEYATLKEYFRSNVKNVLWIYFEGTDLNDLKNELNSNILRKYLKDDKFSQNLKNKQEIINDIIRKSIEDTKVNKFSFNYSNFIKLNSSRAFLNQFFLKNKKIENSNNMINQLETILSLANNFVKENNAKLYFIYLPDYPRYKSNKIIKNDQYKIIKKSVSQLDIPFIDIHEDVFQKEINKLKLFPFEKSGHYNEYGYYKVANAIYSFIENKNN